MKTKVISLLLCLVMALSLVPAALAEGEDLSVYNGNEAVDYVDFFAVKAYYVC